MGPRADALVKLVRPCNGLGAEAKDTAIRPVRRGDENDLGVRDHRAHWLRALAYLVRGNVGDLIERRKREPVQGLVQGQGGRPARLLARSGRHGAEVEKQERNLAQRDQSMEPGARGGRQIVLGQKRGERVARIEKRLQCLARAGPIGRRERMLLRLCKRESGTEENCQRHAEPAAPRAPFASSP